MMAPAEAIELLRHQRAPAAAESAPMLLWIAGADRRLRFLNRNASSFTGLAAGQLLGGWTGLVHPADRDRYITALTAAFDARRPLRAQYRLRRGDGTYRWLLEHCGPVRDGVDAGGYAGWSVDISDFQRTERALRKRIAELEEAARLLEALADASNQAIYSRDRRGRVRFANRVARERLRRGELRTVDAQALRSADGHDDGHGLRSPLRDDRGNVVGMLAVERGDGVEPLAAAAAANDAASAARERDRFLAIVSHELRSPLNIIQSWAYVLEQQAADASPAVKRALGGIRTGVQQQVRMIDGLLDATRVVSGQVQLARRPLVAREIVEAVVESMRPRCVARELRLITALALGDEQVDGDAERLQQVLTHLLDNAVKFSPAGGCVRVEARAEGGRLRIAVSDEGCGIDSAFLPQLFEPFRQADLSSARGHDGLGLGLALVRHLTELHGGSVRAHSEGRGLGARFEIDLPLLAEGGPAASLPSLAGLRVLVVDDLAEARESTCALLQNAGARPLAAAGAGEALQVLERCGDARPQVLLCDLAMPGEDGYAALGRIRRWEEEHAIAEDDRMRAVALSAFALDEERQRALACGFSRHVSKPVIAEQLIRALAEVSARAEPA